MSGRGSVADRADTIRQALTKDCVERYRASLLTGSPIEGSHERVPRHAIDREALTALDELLAENQQLREALSGLDAPIAWLVENYPKAIREMPWDYYLAIPKAGSALAAVVREPAPPAAMPGFTDGLDAALERVESGEPEA